jgi:hypothetical protein
LDASGATAGLLRRHYHRTATVCGTPVLLKAGADRSPPGGIGSCG